MKRSHPKKILDLLYLRDLRILEQYISPETINMVDEDGYTLLWIAATALDLNINIVRLLLKHGADPNVRIREGWTLLHFAADQLQKELAAQLLRAGCDPNAINDAGETPLSKVLFAFNPKKDLINLLLEHGADPDAKHGGGESAREIAIRTGQLDLFPSR